jgi:hypothetical protein
MGERWCWGGGGGQVKVGVDDNSGQGIGAQQLEKSPSWYRSSEWSRCLGPTRLGGRVVRLINETLVAALNHLFATFVSCPGQKIDFSTRNSFVCFFLPPSLLVLFAGCCYLQ